jgi:hypothetical protein
MERGHFLKYRELQELSLAYLLSSSYSEKITILQKTWKYGGSPGLSLLSKFLGLSYDYLYVKGNIETLRIQKNRSRRGRSPMRKNPTLNAIEIRKAAVEAAMGRVELYSGGKKTRHVSSNGCVKNVSYAQAMQSILGQ